MRLEVKRNAHPGLWREGIVIEDNYVHDVALEGMYVGPNYQEGELPLRNIEIRNNLVEDIGWEGINAKSMWAGDNRIHHNIVRRAGKNSSNSSKSTQYSGIKTARYREDLQQLDRDNRPAWNSGVDAERPEGVRRERTVRSAHLEQRHSGRGRAVASVHEQKLWHQRWRPGGLRKPVPLIYNNTIVNSRESAINVASNVGPGFVRDNIAAGTRTIRSSLLPVSWTS